LRRQVKHTNKDANNADLCQTYFLLIYPEGHIQVSIVRTHRVDAFVALNLTKVIFCNFYHK